MDPVSAAISALPVTGPILLALMTAVVFLAKRYDAVQEQRVKDAQNYAGQIVQMSREVTTALGGVSNALGGVKESQSEFKTLLNKLDDNVDEIRRPRSR